MLERWNTLILFCICSLGQVGCLLERVTGEEIPLDPRFYAAVEKFRGTADQGADQVCLFPV